MSSLWIAAKEKVQSFHRWHVHRRWVLAICFLIALLVWLFSTTIARALGIWV